MTSISPLPKSVKTLRGLDAQAFESFVRTTWINIHGGEPPVAYPDPISQVTISEDTASIRFDTEKEGWRLHLFLSEKLGPVGPCGVDFEIFGFPSVLSPLTALSLELRLQQLRILINKIEETLPTRTDGHVTRGQQGR
jgi:hypothetical protein